MQLAPGTDVGQGRYQVEDLLGQGGMAAVYRVRHVQLGTPLALKVLTAASPDQRERLLREGRAQASLRHGNVVSVVDVVEVDGLAALVMEYIDGPDLAYVLKRRRLSLGQADDLMRGILAGVAAAHDQGFVHRDLKPGNILVAAQRSRPVPRVADFGLVKELSGGAEGATRTGALMGTPAYMAPEQVRDAGRVDARADVFALGAIAYELVTGRRAFAGDDAFEIFEAIVKGRHTPVAEVAPELSPRLARVIETALATDPAARFADAGAMEAAWLDDAPALSAAQLWAGDALVSRSPGASSGATPQTPHTYALEDGPAVEATAAAPSATLDAATTPASGTLAPAEVAPVRASRSGLWAGLALAAAAVGGLGWWTTRAEAEPVFTIEGAPPGIYADPAKQKQLERAWDTALGDDRRRARVELEPLIAEAPVPVEVAAFRMMLAGYFADLQPYVALLQRVDPSEKAGDRGPSICVRSMESVMIMASQGWTEASSAEASRRRDEEATRLLAWLDAHPDDALSALCLNAVQPELAEEWFARIERADPTGSTPLLVHDVVDWQLIGGRVDDARRWVERARAVDPTSASLKGLEGTVLARAGEPEAALARFEEALGTEPSRLDLRRQAAVAALQVGDEPAARTHVGLLMAEEWDDETREENLAEIASDMIRAGRPQWVIDSARSLTYPARALWKGPVASALLLGTGLVSLEQLEAFAGMFRRGSGPDGARSMAQTLDLMRGSVDAVLLARTPGAERPPPDARLHDEAQAILATLDGDPQPWLDLAEAKYQQFADAVPDGAPALRVQRCRYFGRRAAAYTLVDQRDAALLAFASIAAPGACGDHQDAVYLRAMAAGQLALDAFERGAPEEAAPHVATYQALWPTAEATMPIAQALAAYGVVTGPNREAWEAERR